MTPYRAAYVFFALVGASILGFALNPVHAPPIPDAVGTLWMGLALLAALILGIGATWQRDRLAVPWPVFSFAGLGAAAFLSGVANKSVFAQTYGTTNLLWLFGALGLASALSYAGQMLAQSSRPEQGVRWMGSSIVIAGALTSVIEMIQSASPGFSAGGWIAAMPAGLTPYGNLMQRNHAAALLGLALLFVAYFARPRSAPASRWIGTAWAIAAALLSCGIVLTASRMGIAYVALAGGLYGWLHAVSRRQSAAGRRVGGVWVIGALSIGVVGYLALAWIATHTASPHAITAADRFENAGMSARDAIWSQAWAMFRAHPIFGAGWGTFSAYALSGALTSPHPQYVNNAHDIVLQILSETGLVGLLLTGLPLVLSAWCTLRKGSAWFAPPWRKLAVAVCLLIGGYSLVEYPLWSPLFLAPFALFWGMSSAPSPAGGRLLAFGIKTIGLSLSVLAVAALTPAIGQYREISSATMLSTVPGVLQSTGFDAGTLRHREVLPLFQPEIDYLAFQATPVGMDDLASRIALGNRVAMHYTTPQVLEKLAALYILQGDAVQAATRMAAASRIDPTKAHEVLGLLRKAALSGNPVVIQALRVYTQLNAKG